jgi:uncharacterized protein YuzE
MSKNEVKYDYDCKNDSLFIYCTEPYEYEVSLELDNNVILDLDTDGKPVAFEFLNASKVFKLDKGYFKNLVKICIQSDITEEAINLKVRLDVLVHNKTQLFEVNRIATNLTNVPAIETMLVTA